MAPNRLMVSTNLYGNVKGTSFDDSSHIEDLTAVAITRIVVHHDEFIDAFQVHYTGNCKTITRGSPDGIKTEIILARGELITTINGHSCGNNIVQLKFATNKGIIYGPYGIAIGDRCRLPFIWSAADGAPANLAHRMGLLYFSGQANSYIHRLRATFAVYPTLLISSDVSALCGGPSSNVKFEKRIPPDPAVYGVSLSAFARNIMSSVVTIHVGPEAVLFYGYEGILCRTPFFRAALQGKFKEAAEKIIKMPEEKPEVFSALIEHLYTGNYTYTYDPDATPCANGTPTPDLAQGCFHASVYAVAFTYDWPPLASDAMSNFLSVLPKLAGMDIVRLWKAGYENGLTLPVCADGGRLAEFGMVLPKLLKGLYRTDGEEMESTVSEFPALANDFMSLLVSGSED